MKKLVIFIGGLNYGGMERVAFIMTDLLKDKYDITLATLYQTKADYDVDFKSYDLNVPPKRGKIGIITTALKRLVKTRKMKRKLKPDIVFSFGMYTNYLNALTHNSEKIIMGIRSYDWLDKPFVSTKFDRYVISKFDSINSVSKLIATDCVKYWGIPSERISVIYNPYNLCEIYNKSVEPIDDFNFNEDDFYYISMGRLSSQKAFNHLIKAFSIVCNKYSCAKLIIMGNGELRDKLIQLVNDLEIANSVFLIGGKANPYKYIKQSDVYVLSSLSEGFPNALVEAMCVGVPVIATDCNSGPREILAPHTDIHKKCQSMELAEYGILLPEVQNGQDYQRELLDYSVYEMARGMEYLYNNPNYGEEISKRARNRVLDFTYENFAASMEKELEKIDD